MYYLKDKGYLNPVQLRLNELKLSQSKCASLAGISRMVVLRSTQGMYQTLAARMVRILDIPYVDLSDSYVEWQQDQRLLQAVWVGTAPVYETQYHPFVAWRLLYAPEKTRMGICKLLCLHPNTIKLYEEGTQKTVPDSLLKALDTGGMDRENRHRLVDLSAKWISSLGSSTGLQE